MKFLSIRASSSFSRIVLLLVRWLCFYRLTTKCQYCPLPITLPIKPWRAMYSLTTIIIQSSQVLWVNHYYWTKILISEISSKLRFCNFTHWDIPCFQDTLCTILSLCLYEGINNLFQDKGWSFSKNLKLRKVKEIIQGQKAISVRVRKNV